MDKSCITFDLCSTSNSKILGVEVLLDNATVYYNDSFVSSFPITVSLPNDETDHSLKIVLKNKPYDYTVLDPLGAIVQDVNLNVTNIMIDDVKIGHDIMQTITYCHDCNGTDQFKEHKFYGEMGCNGTVELKFTTPIHLWLLENS